MWGVGRRGVTPIVVIVATAAALAPAGASAAKSPYLGEFDFGKEAGRILIERLAGVPGAIATTTEPISVANCRMERGELTFHLDATSGEKITGSYERPSRCSNPGSWEATFEYHSTGGFVDGGPFLEICTSTPSGSSGHCLFMSPAPKLPIVFIHGFLGSRIACNGDTLWPDAPAEFHQMKLDKSGTRNSGHSRCNRWAKADGILKTFLGTSVYKSTLKFLKKLPRKHHLYVYDWRRGPEQLVRGLDKVVNRARKQADSHDVVLYAHSMGGLIARWYLSESLKAIKRVDRVVTAGSPYWGSPAPLLALTHGWTSPHSNNALDVLIVRNKRLKGFSRNLAGGYFLYPGPAYLERGPGPWLTLPAFDRAPLGAADMPDAIDFLGGNPALYSKAQAWHAQRADRAWPDELLGVDYQYVVGTGVQTATAIQLKEKLKREPTYTWGSGDGTVPMISAAAGLPPSSSQTHYVCGVGHVALPGHKKVRRMIKDYLLYGEPVRGRPPCSL